MKVLSWWFNKSLGPFNMLTFKGCYETVFFLESGITNFLTFYNFQNKVGLASIFFFKMFKSWWRNRTKKSEKVFGFKSNWIWIGEDNLSQSRTGYSSLAVSDLRNTPKIYYITKGDIFQIRFTQSDGKIWWKYSQADFPRAWDPLIRWLSRGVLKRCLLESGLTNSFTVCNSQNKAPMMLNFFPQIVWNLM